MRRTAQSQITVVDTEADVLTNPLQIAIVDDHAMFSESLARVFADDSAIVCKGQFSGVQSALSGLRSSTVDVVLLDVDLGPERGIDFVIAAGQVGIQARILVLTAGCSGQQAIQLMRHGVAGILHKHQPVATLREAILKVAQGGVYLEQKYLAPVFDCVTYNRAAESRLSEREQILIRSVLQGLTNKEIGERLGISEGAVKAALHQVFRSLGVRTRVQMAKVALERYRDQLQ